MKRVVQDFKFMKNSVSKKVGNTEMKKVIMLKKRNEESDHVEEKELMHSSGS